MKKLLLTSTLLISLPAFSAPYIGLEYGAGIINNDVDSVFETETGGLDPELKEGVFSAFVGYQFSKRWGLELGYRQFKFEDEFSQTSNIDATSYLEQEWSTEVNAKQVTLMPTYSFHINQKWKLKAAAGLTYTQYEQKDEYSTEVESIYDLDSLEPETSQSSAESTDQWGGIASVGIEYNIIHNLNIGASVKYHADSVSDGVSFNLSTVYYF